MHVLRHGQEAPAGGSSEYGRFLGAPMLSLLKLSRARLEPDRFADQVDVRLDIATREALQVLCESAERDADLTEIGRLFVVDRIMLALLSRKALDELPPAPPLSQPPILIVGLPRSGTTLLHHALATDPSLRALTAWEVGLPVPLPGVNRRDLVADRLRRLGRLAPELSGSHAIDVDRPEECVHLLEPSLRSPSFWHFTPVRGYVSWLAHADPKPGYRIYARLLRHLAAHDPGRRLVLKGPAHVPALGALLDELPGTQIVWTHRDPAEVLPSLEILYQRSHRPGSHRPRDPANHALNRRLLLAQLSADVSVDAHHVRFSDLLGRTAATVDGVREALGLKTGLPSPVARPPATHPRAEFQPDEQVVVDRYRSRRL